MAEYEAQPLIIEKEKLISWYGISSEILENKIGLLFPPFLQRLKDSELIFNKKLNIEHALGQVFIRVQGMIRS